MQTHMKILLKFPLAIIKGADLTRLQPSGDAMEVKGMLIRLKLRGEKKKRAKQNLSYVAHSPSHGALFSRAGLLVRLTFDAWNNN